MCLGRFIVLEVRFPSAGTHLERDFLVAWHEHCEPTLPLTFVILGFLGSRSMTNQGYDSIVARGTQEPDPSKDVVIKIDGKSVSVPQGKPEPQPAYKGSRFSNSEYLVRFDVWTHKRPGVQYEVIALLLDLVILSCVLQTSNILHMLNAETASRFGSWFSLPPPSSLSTSGFPHDRFWQVYKESQQRIRYMLTVKC